MRHGYKRWLSVPLGATLKVFISLEMEHKLLVDAFLSEAALEKPQTLTKLNQLFWVWLTECYQNKPHSSLKNNMSPESAFKSDPKPLKYNPPENITDAFLHCDERKVDKAGCISFAGQKYEVGVTFIGCKVEVTYDPVDTTERRRCLPASCSEIRGTRGSIL